MGGDSFLAALREVIGELFAAADGGLLESDDVNVVFVVLSQFEFGAFVEEVVEFAAVDLVEGEFGFQVAELRLSGDGLTLARYSNISLAPSV